MAKFQCPACGQVYEGTPRRCPHCDVLFRYRGEINVISPVEEEEVKEEEQPLQEPVPVVAEPVAPVVEAQPVVKKNTRSFFDGKSCQIFGWTVLGFLVTVFTLGLLFSCAYYWVTRWKTNHTIVRGHRLHLKKDALGTLICWWFLWYFLSIITLTIYAWFVPVRLGKWRSSYTTMKI